MKKYIILTYLYGDETDRPELVYNEVEAKSLEEAYEYADVLYNCDKIVILKKDLIKLLKELK